MEAITQGSVFARGKIKAEDEGENSELRLNNHCHAKPLRIVLGLKGKKELERKDILFKDPLFPAGDKILQKHSGSIFNRNKSIYGGREMGIKGSDIEWLRPKVKL